MAKGGARPGAGRKAGVPNKRTAATVAAVEASGLMPLDYMLSVLRDPEQPQEARMDAATKAAPYVHSKLNAVTHSGSIGGRTAEQMSDDELATIAALRGGQAPVEAPGHKVKPH